MSKLGVLFKVIPPVLLAPALVPLAAVVTIEVALIWVLKTLFLALHDPAAAADWVSRYNSLGGLAETPKGAILVIGLGALVFVMVRAWVLQGLWARVYGVYTRAQAAATARVFRRYLRQRYLLHSTVSTSRQKMLLLGSATWLFQQLVFPIGLIAAEITIAFAIAVVLLIWEPVPALLLFAYLGLAVFVSSKLPARRSVEAGRARWRAFHELRDLADNVLGALGTIRVTGSEAKIEARFHEINDRHSAALGREKTLATGIRNLLEIGLVSSILVIFAGLALAGRPTEALLETLIVFSAAAVRLIPIGLRVLGLAHAVRAHEPDIEALAEELELPEDDLDQPAANRDRAPFEKELRLVDLYFRYPARGPGLQISDFRIQKGDWIWIRGASGAGKSTLIEHVLGLIDAPGHLLIDGRPGSALEAMRRSRVALVPQRPMLLNATVDENIRFPDTEIPADRDRMVRILAALDLDLSLDRPVGEDGRQLSGGQGQRVAVARAIYARPAFLILDEATSDLDAATSDRVFAAIREFCPEVTLVAISHDSLRAGFSRVVTLDAGKIVDTRLAQPGAKRGEPVS